jgi:ribosomal protein S27E
MQVRCQRCGFMFTMSREAISAALEETEKAKSEHYGVECPKCRHHIKVAVKDIKHAQPR